MKMRVFAFALVAASLSQTAGAITATKEYVDRKDAVIVSNTYTKAETDARIAELSQRTSLEPATNYTDEAVGELMDGLGTGDFVVERSYHSVDSDTAYELKVNDGAEVRTSSQIFLQIDGKATPVGVTNIVTNIVTKAYVESLGIEAGISGATATNILEGIASPILLKSWYPDGSVVSETEFTKGIRYGSINTEDRTIEVLQFSRSYNPNNSDLTGPVVIPPYIDTNGVRLVVVGVADYNGYGGYSSNVTSIVAPTTIKTIGNSSFVGCRSIVSVSFPAATTIGYSVFEDCISLSSISIPSATTIGMSAFRSCGSITSIALPSATTIGAYAFQHCDSLTSISIPSVTSIGDYAFTYCESLTSIDFGNSLASVPSIGNRAFVYDTTNCVIIVPDNLYTNWISADGWSNLVNQGFRFIKHSEFEDVKKYEVAQVVSNTVTKAFVEDLGIESGIQEESDPVWDAAKGGYATTGTVANVSEAVGTLWSYVYGDSVWIAVTNSMRTVGGVSTSFQLWNVRNGATNLVYWSKEEITNVTHDLIHDCKTNLEQTVRNAVAEMPDKAWSKYQSATGNEAPDGVTIVSTPTIQITGGGEWCRYVDVSSNSVWFLKSNGLYTFVGDANGYFRILDDEGNATFEVRKTDSYLVDAVASSVHFDADGNFCVSFESNIQPVIYTTASLSAPHFLPEGDDPNVTVTWTQSGGVYTATLEQAVKGPSLFAYAKVEVQGETVIRNAAPTDVSGGILCTDGVHKCRPVYSNGAITWEVMP